MMVRVETEMARAIQRSGSRLKIFHGLQVMEIQPQVGWTKGDCVLWIRDVVRRTSGDRLTVFYMGDDWTDEFAFDALAGDALTISVGSLVPASKAAHRVETCGGASFATIAARACTGTTMRFTVRPWQRSGSGARRHRHLRLPADRRGASADP
jgi:trehalose-phosphatase